MKHVGRRVDVDFIGPTGAEGLKALDQLNTTINAIAKPIGCPKGLYRFKTHEEKNRFDENLVLQSMIFRQSNKK